MTEISSKHATVLRAPYVLYMAFVDMRNFKSMLPPDKQESLQADYDTLTAQVQGYNVGVKVEDRVPYSRISFMDWGSPFAFHIDVLFDACGGDPDKTDLHIDVKADLNFMMNMLLGNRIKEALDKIVDSIAAISEGRMPEGVDPSMFPEGFDPKTFNPNDGTWRA